VSSAGGMILTKENRSVGIRNCRFATLYTTKLIWTGWKSLNCTHVKTSFVPHREDNL